MTTNALSIPMTNEELNAQKQLQQAINKRLDIEKRDRELHPEKYANEQLYDCSLGMNKILESISVAALFKGDRRQTFDVFIINANTIARNCYDKKLKTTDILNNIQKDINTLMKYIQLYFVEQKQYIEKPYVIVYLPIYNIHKNYARPLSPDRQAIQSLAYQYFKNICTNPPQVNKMSDDCVAYAFLAGTNNLPHRDISSFIINKADKGVMRMMHRRYLLISHMCIDFHLQNTLGNKLYILESYTGKIKTIKDLGSKIFKNPDIPFNQYTHLLFGDSNLIRPMVYRAEKKKVCDIAKNNHWNKKPATLILSDIRRLNVVPISALTFLKF